MTRNFALWRKPWQRLVRGIHRGSAPPRRRTPSSKCPCTIGRTTSPAPCWIKTKHLCFGPVSGLEVKRALTPDKPWLTSSLPSRAFSWPTRNGAKQPRAKAQTTSKLALGTGRRTFGRRPIKMAQAMALHNIPNITIALHKTFHGKYSFYETVLYRAELRNMGIQTWKKSTWNPKFEVRSIPVKGAPRHESGCALTAAAKFQLEFYAERPVTVWCRTCTTLQACGPKQQVEKKSPKAKCIGNC